MNRRWCTSGCLHLICRCCWLGEPDRCGLRLGWGDILRLRLGNCFRLRRGNCLRRLVQHRIWISRNSLTFTKSWVVSSFCLKVQHSLSETFIWYKRVRRNVNLLARWTLMIFCF